MFLRKQVFAMTLCSMFLLPVGYGSLSGQFNTQTSFKTVKPVEDMTAKELRQWIKGFREHCQKKTRLYEEISNRPHFWIEGEIIDYDEEGITIWGYARPETRSLNETYGSAINKKANLYVRNYIKAAISGNYYEAVLHFFVGKTSGTNAFGARVPVLIYDEGGPKCCRDTMAQWYDREYKKTLAKWEERLKGLEKAEKPVRKDGKKGRDEKAFLKPRTSSSVNTLGVNNIEL